VAGWPSERLRQPPHRHLLGPRVRPEIARRRSQVSVPEQLLCRSDIHALPDEVGGEGAAERVGHRRPFVQVRLPKHPRQHAVHHPAGLGCARRRAVEREWRSCYDGESEDSKLDAGMPVDKRLLPLFSLDDCGAKLTAAGYRPDDLLPAYEELCAIMGEDWIHQEKSRVAGGMSDTHPLLRAFGTADVEMIATAMELVVALRRFRGDPKLAGLLAHLRDWDQFDDFYYALRVALRFDLLGCEVTLEPDTPGGRADALVAYGRLPIGIECANVRSRVRGRQPVDEVHSLLKGVALPERTVLEIRLKVALNGRVRRAVRRSAAALAKQWQGAPLRGRSDLADFSLRSADAEEWGKLRGWDGSWPPPVKTAERDGAVVLQNRVMARDKEDLSSYDFSTQELRSVVTLQFADSDEPPSPCLEDMIDRRVSRKMDQMASHSPEWTSVLFLNVPRGLREIDDALVWRRLSSTHFPAHEGLSAVVLTENTWTPWGTNALSMIPFANIAAKRMFPEALMRAFVHQERRLSVARLLSL
jgi:hypothetical protein